jgi:hypothetical protein
MPFILRGPIFFENYNGFGFSANEFAVTGANKFANTVMGANKFANTVTGANKFANTFQIDLKRSEKTTIYGNVDTINIRRQI